MIFLARQLLHRKPTALASFRGIFQRFDFVLGVQMPDDQISGPHLTTFEYPLQATKQ
jgi:hypothetical protein